MPGLLIGITPEKKKAKPLERPGLTPPPFGGSKASAPPTAPDPEPDPYGAADSPMAGMEKETVAGSDDAGSPMFAQEQVGYCTAEQKCGSCDYFVDPQACKYVQGTIDAEGCCPLHSARGAASEALETPMESAPEAGGM